MAFFASLVFTTSCINQAVTSAAGKAITENINQATMNTDSLVNFTQKYTQPYSSQTPGNVAASLAKVGYLKVNNGIPDDGEIAVARV